MVSVDPLIHSSKASVKYKNSICRRLNCQCENCLRCYLFALHQLAVFNLLLFAMPNSPGEQQKIFDRLRRRMLEPLPGAKAQYRLAPSHRPGPEMNPGPSAPVKQAGVLLPLFYRAGALRICMIRRPEESGPHSRQIAFPGGRREDSDADLQATALRETTEEIGLAIPPDNVAGALSSLYVAPSQFYVEPFVALILAPDQYRADEEEVAEVLEFQLQDFAKSENFRIEEWIVRGFRTTVPHFRIDGETIWGASAMMLAELLEILKDCGLKLF
ncbi:MAG: CoA pyrophosphatase [Leptospirales bacterium]|nr:CoA pyrophosphatase [Leptospirales bacterium]